MSELNTSNLVSSMQKLTMSAAAKADSLDFEGQACIVNDFLAVLWEAGLIEITEEMTDLEKIERGVYAAQLFLASAITVAQHEDQRTEEINRLNACLLAS